MGIRGLVLAPAIVGALVLGGDAFAQPVDPYERDPNAPVPRSDEARGWEIRPRRSRRAAVDWVKDTSRKGAQFTLQMVLAPVEGALKLNQRFAIVRRVEDLFYNEERTAGVLPSASFLTGFGSSIGGSMFHKDMFGHDERAALKAELGGVHEQSYQLSLDFPHIADDRFYAEGLGRYEGTSELYFNGLGHPPERDPPAGGDEYDPREADVESRYEQRRLLGMISAGVKLGRPRLLRTGISVIYNRREFDGLAGREDGLENTYDTTNLAAFEEGEDVLEITLDATLDTRDRVGKTGGGLLVDLFAGGAPSRDGNPYLHYGVEASVFQTLFRRGRVLVLRAMLEGVEGDEERIPFTDLPRLGGPNRLRGYRLDRFRDNLAAIGTIEYRYPIHYYASGLFFAEAGKVARTFPAMFDGEHWQPGFGGGIVVHTLEDVKLRLDLAYGEGFEVFVSTDALAAFSGRRRRL